MHKVKRSKSVVRPSIWVYHRPRWQCPLQTKMSASVSVVWAIRDCECLLATWLLPTGPTPRLEICWLTLASAVCYPTTAEGVSQRGGYSTSAWKIHEQKQTKTITQTTNTQNRSTCQEKRKKRKGSERPSAREEGELRLKKFLIRKSGGGLMWKAKQLLYIKCALITINSQMAKGRHCTMHTYTNWTLTH